MLYWIHHRKEGGGPRMQTRIRGNEYRTTIVCVDSYHNGILQGRFYNPYLKSGEGFQSLSQFLIKMEQTLDTMNLPQSFTAIRSLKPRSISVRGLPSRRLMEAFSRSRMS